ncbi:MAG: hypothetical protein ACOYZ7_06225 [Chloroflexota bacterium]
MTNLRVIVEGILGGLTIGGTVLFSPLLRPWYSRWGTTEDEARRRLPGDELAPTPRSEITCALTIDAPVASVWPWLVQLGCQRAGWYSYDLLDNGGQPSADRILPEHQHLAVGDRVLLTPDGRLGYPVIAVEPQKVLVLGGTLDTHSGQAVSAGDPLPEAFFSGINAYVVEPIGETATRLIFRQRLDWNPSLANTLMYRIFLEPISFVMGRKMLRGVERRSVTRPPG